MTPPPQHATEQILGIQFFHGSVAEAVVSATSDGGLVVAPSGTCFERFIEDADYRRALLTADLILPDSGAMVALWTLLTGRPLNRISGYAYIKALLEKIDLREVCWVLPHERALEKLSAWCARGGTAAVPSKEAPMDGTAPVSPGCYLAPIYDREVNDEALLGWLSERKPRHIVIAIGAGAQEKLGCYLREHLSWRPGIHCIGGALGFLTGDQVAIPEWADRLYLGWFLRFLSQPRAFLPRLWKARILPQLITKYGKQLPPLR